MQIHCPTIIGAVAATLACLANRAEAQAPGLPVLQNAFGNPGLAAAANLGGGSGQSFYGAAAAWGLGGGRLSLSAAAGAQRANEATRGAYGGRVSANVWTSTGGALGAAGFVGIGGAPSTSSASIVTNPAVMTVPVGLSIGYRRPLGRTRGISAYVSPFYRWDRTDSVTVTSAGTLRASLGIDFAFSRSLGVTVGGELGKAKGRSRGGAFGAAVSFVPGRR